MIGSCGALRVPGPAVQRNFNVADGPQHERVGRHPLGDWDAAAVLEEAERGRERGRDCAGTRFLRAELEVLQERHDASLAAREALQASRGKPRGGLTPHADPGAHRAGAPPAPSAPQERSRVQRIGRQACGRQS